MNIKNGKTLKIIVFTENIKSAKISFILAITSFILSIFIVWLVPKKSGDLFVALAGGNDVLSGKLGHPDEWSFVTNGNIWINQNWGADLLFSAVNKIFGFNGLLLINILLISACALFIVLAIRTYKMTFSIAATIASLAMIFSVTFIDLRPNLISLMFSALFLWLIYCTNNNPNMSWILLPVMILWSNMHGGYIFGLGMMGFWGISLIINSLILKNIEKLKRNWIFFVVTILAIIFSFVLSPFGITNILHPFIIAKSEFWKTISEWRPVWDINGFGSINEFLVIIFSIYILIIILLISVLIKKSIKDIKFTNIAEIPEMNKLVFDILMLFVVTVMALNSRRFIPLAFIITAPLLSRLIGIITAKTKLNCIIILSIISIALSVSTGLPLINYYINSNLTQNDISFYDKKISLSQSFPVGLTKFLNKNNITGNMMNEWTWEGYIRLYCPQIKVFCGGRAQQIYDENIAAMSFDFFQINVSTTDIRNLDAHMIAYNPRERDFPTSYTLIREKWVIIYTDKNSVLYVDNDFEYTKNLVNLALENKLIYNDKTNMNESMDLLKKCKNYINTTS